MGLFLDYFAGNKDFAYKIDISLVGISLDILLSIVDNFVEFM